jgi:hypothetical protein
MTSSKRKGWS